MRRGGKRSPWKGLGTPEGKALLKDFAFNSEAGLGQVLKKRVAVAQGKISIKGLVPKEDLVAPKGATHVRLTGIRFLIDPEGKRCSSESVELTLKLDRKAQDVALAPPALKGKGYSLLLLQVRFLQELSGSQHDLKNTAGNVMDVLYVE